MQGEGVYMPCIPLWEQLAWGEWQGSPSRSVITELPSSSEKPMRAQGRNGAWKLSKPKKLTLT